MIGSEKQITMTIGKKMTNLFKNWPTSCKPLTQEEIEEKRNLKGESKSEVLKEIEFWWRIHANCQNEKRQLRIVKKIMSLPRPLEHEPILN